MSQEIGRNAPCPCGSGKKYKKCCLKKPSAQAPPSPSPGGGFRFVPGGYGQAELGFVPAMLSEKRVGENWRPHFLLANPARPFDRWTEAAELAIHDLDYAYAAKATGGDEAAARRLDALGYKSVTGYRLEDFRPIDLAPGLGGAGPPSEPMAELGDGAGARAALLDAVDEQIRSGEPAETALTLSRLVQAGHSEDAARELIATLMAAEVFAMATEGRGFDEELYVENLRRLPELPAELQASVGT